MQQASFHYEWVYKHKSLPKETTDLTVVVISPRRYIEPGAEHATEDLYIVSPQEIVNLANLLGPILTDCLQKLKYGTYEEARQFLGEYLMRHKLHICGLKEQFTMKPLKDLPIGRPL